MKIEMPVIVFVCLVIECIIAIPPISLSSASSSSSSLTIDGITCDKEEHFVSHIHMHLDIFINGKEFVVPSNIGIIPGNCIYWLHTHYDTGVIHLESPDTRTFTLGQFFHIWGETLSNNQIFNNMIGDKDNNTLNVYVNGKKVDSKTDYGQTPLNEHDEIAIVYGKPPNSIPSNYGFPEGL
ncbi:MAG TPA: hypothetical protein VJ250_08925 [Nitrososphaeraceae archaeon]|nr:hypothetical protein [Nitrososphaeraceae archaeon]